MRAPQRADHASGGGRDVDDAAKPLCLHRRQHRFDQQERRGEVHLERAPPLVRGQLREARWQRHGCVIHQDVDPAEALQGAGNESVDDARLGQIARKRDRSLAERRRYRCGARLIPDVHTNGRAALVESLSGGTAEASRRARHDSDASVEVSERCRRGQGLVGSKRRRI